MTKVSPHTLKIDCVPEVDPKEANLISPPSSARQQYPLIYNRLSFYKECSVFFLTSSSPLARSVLVERLVQCIAPGLKGNSEAHNEDEKCLDRSLVYPYRHSWGSKCGRPVIVAIKTSELIWVMLDDVWVGQQPFSGFVCRRTPSHAIHLRLNLHQQHSYLTCVIASVSSMTHTYLIYPYYGLYLPLG
jgi:hypothetical protein